MILETFLQFKDQCHVNDEFLKTLPPKDSAEDSEASEGELAIDRDYLEEDEDDDDDGAETPDSEEQGLVEDVEPLRRPKRKVTQSPKKETLKAKQLKAVVVSKQKMVEDPLYIKRSPRVQRHKARPESSSKKNIAVSKMPPPEIPEFSGPQPTEDELPKLQDSYPNYFHFERGSRSLYYTLVYYGERFNSAVYGASYTYWQCAHRSKFKCPALVHVSNDYTNFERRFEHTHGDQKAKGKPELLTPKQALPVVFRICWHKVMKV